MIEAHPVNFVAAAARDATVSRSPEYVQLSTAAAITLGLVSGRMYRTNCTHCLNLLLTYAEGCRANCSYCGLARHREEARQSTDRNFIRVDWPTRRFDEIVARVLDGGDRGAFERMCISMISHPNAVADTLSLLRQWVREVPRIPVSILSNPTTMRIKDLHDMREAGADIFTVALDAATPAIFERTRGRTVASPHRWDHYWQVIDWAARIFGPQRFGVHLICGMGETEHEILQIVQRVQALGGHSHMFAFFPERGSMMEDWPPVATAPWRRVQLARFIIDFKLGDLDRMRFDELGRVMDFGLSADRLQALIQSGKPFQTSGCPGSTDPEISACNRPYGDSPVSDIRSFPFALNGGDVAIMRRQLAGEQVTTSAADDVLDSF